MPNPIFLVKQAAVEAVEAGRPVSISFGTVISANPLKVQVDQKTIYPSKMLIVPERLTDHEVEIENAAEPYKVMNALKVNDEVILFRMQGGKQYLIFDRIGGDR